MHHLIAPDGTSGSLWRLSPKTEHLFVEVHGVLVWQIWFRVFSERKKQSVECLFGKSISLYRRRFAAAGNKGLTVDMLVPDIKPIPVNGPVRHNLVLPATFEHLRSFPVSPFLFHI